MINTDPQDSSLELSRNIPRLTANLSEEFDAMEALLQSTPSLGNRVLQRAVEKRQELEANERTFIDQVLGAVTASDDGESPIVLIFDIDETLVKKMYDEAGTDIVRPGLRPLAQYLKGKYDDRLHIGLLSSRGQEFVEAFGESGAFSDEGGESMLDQMYIESSRDGRILKELEDEGRYFYNMYTTEIVEQIEPYLSVEAKDVLKSVSPDDEFAIQDVLHTKYPMGSIQDPKLSILCEMARQNPENRYVLVDDFAVVDMLGAGNVRGVSLYGKGRFSLG